MKTGLLRWLFPPPPKLPDGPIKRERTFHLLAGPCRLIEFNSGEVWTVNEAGSKRLGESFESVCAMWEG